MRTNVKKRLGGAREKMCGHKPDEGGWVSHRESDPGDGDAGYKQGRQAGRQAAYLACPGTLLHCICVPTAPAHPNYPKRAQPQTSQPPPTPHRR